MLEKIYVLRSSGVNTLGDIIAICDFKNIEGISEDEATAILGKLYAIYGPAEYDEDLPF